MYIYNVTTNVSETVVKEWLVWMKATFIPAMLSNKKLKKALLTEVLVEEDMGGVTYSTQYFCENEQILNEFLNNDFESIIKSHSKFKGQLVDFSTKLKVVKEF